MRNILRGYFDELTSVENENYFEEQPCVEELIQEILRREVEEALQCTKNGREGRPSGVTSELLKFVGSSGIDELLIVYNQIISDCRAHE